MAAAESIPPALAETLGERRDDDVEDDAAAAYDGGSFKVADN